MFRKILCGVVVLCSATAAAIDYPHSTLEDAYAAAVFDPAAADSFVFVVTADSHYDLSTDNVHTDDVEETVQFANDMAPPPAFLLVDGDLIESGSPSFGSVPSEVKKAQARQEFTDFKEDLDRLDSGIPYKLTLGNHDTYPYEENLDLFRSAWPARDPYGSFDIGGIHFVLMNGGHCAFPEPPEVAWLKGDLLGIPADRTVVAFVHQPALGDAAVERGVGKAVRAAFWPLEGEVWLVCGHHHSNNVRVYALPKTEIVQATVTTCSPAKWGCSEKPGCWVYCARAGHIVARIYYKFGQAFRIDPEPNRISPKEIPQPFGGRSDILLRVLVGEDDDNRTSDYLVSHNANDGAYAWFYVGELVYKLPLTGLGGTPAQLGILGSLPQGFDPPAQVFVSDDGVTWQELTVPAATQGLYVFDIPPALVGGDYLHVKITAIRWGGECKLGGLAILGTPEVAFELVSASALSSTRVTVTFNREIDGYIAEVPMNYSITGGPEVLSGALEADGRTVTLTTSPHTVLGTYTLSADGVKDASGNAIAAGSSAEYEYTGQGSGTTSKAGSCAAAAGGTLGAALVACGLWAYLKRRK